MKNIYEFLSWCPCYLAIIIWIGALIYYKDYKILLYCLIFGTIFILTILWQRYFTNKSYKYEKELEK